MGFPHRCHLENKVKNQMKKLLPILLILLSSCVAPQLISYQQATLIQRKHTMKGLKLTFLTGTDTLIRYVDYSVKGGWVEGKCYFLKDVKTKSVTN